MQGDTQSFIVRIWHEVLDKEGRIVTWRGSIDHVGSGKRIYFDDMSALVRFIQEQVGLPTQPRSWWRSLLACIRGLPDPRSWPGSGDPGQHNRI